METLPDSIFIPKFKTKVVHVSPADHTIHNHAWDMMDIPRFYGTREQTVILIDRDTGRVSYTERTLWDDAVEPLSKEDGETKIEFHIEGWEIASN